MATETEEYVVKEVEDAYATATGSWTEADWTHERRPICDEPEHGYQAPCGKCGVSVDSDGNLIYCEGGDSTCQYCLDAEVAASGAEKVAKEAMDAWHVRNFGLALRCIKEAVSLENEFGSAPTWGPVFEAMRSALENEE